MDAFTTLRGTAAPLLDRGKPMANVDTDMIIPKQFLKTTTRTGLSEGLFYELKTDETGAPDPEFVLNKPAFENASVLLAGENFGCGSSREHAPWALLDQGIRCVIAPSFADIFYNNCFKNGILPLTLPLETIENLIGQAGGGNQIFDVDLEAQTVTAPDGSVHAFDIDQSRKANLMAGLDDIGQTLTRDSDISEFEKRRRMSMPWLEKSAI